MISIRLMLDNIKHVDIYQQRYEKLSLNAKDKINIVIKVTIRKKYYIALISFLCKIIN